MWVSRRQACTMLGAVGLGRRRAEQVLDAGLAGAPLWTRSAALYDEALVQRLAGSRMIPWSEAVALSPAGLFVSRRPVDLSLDDQAQLHALGHGWGEVSPWRWVAMRLQLDRHGSLAFVATVAGFVAVGADIVGTRGLSELVLAPPGPWFDSIVGRRLPTGPGRPWVLHLEPFTPAKIAA